MKKYIAIIVIQSVTIFVGCAINNNHIDDVSPPLAITWTIDTLFFTNGTNTGQTLIYDIFGFNDTTVYAAGHDLWGGKGSLWKFNGNTWVNVPVIKAHGGFETQSVSFRIIFGSSDSNFFLGGENMYSNPSSEPEFYTKGILWHYENNFWTKINLLTKFPPNSWTKSSDGSYIVTAEKYLYTLSGGMYVDSIPNTMIKAASKEGFINYAYRTNDGEMFASVRYVDSAFNSVYVLIKKTDSQWIIVDSTSQPDKNPPRWGTYGYVRSTDGTQWSYGLHGIFKLIGGNWINVYSQKNVTHIIADETDVIYALTDQNNILRYSQGSWNVIYDPQNPYLIFGRLWADEKNIFFSFHNGTKSFIFRGKIKIGG